MIERIKNTIGQKCWININKWYNSVLLWYYGFITSNPLIYGVNISFYSRHISRCCNFNFNVINMYPIFACNPFISMESHYYQMLGINFLFTAHSTNVFFLCWSVSGHKLRYENILLFLGSFYDLTILKYTG